MAAKKKTNTGTSTEAKASTEARPSANDTLVTTNNRENNSEDTSVDDLADEEFEVKLLDMGIATEDIQAMRRIDVCLKERSRHSRQAATQAGLSTTAIPTREKEKQRALTTEELEEQINKLKEEELHCNAMRQQIREHTATLQGQAPRREPVPVVPLAHQPIRPRPRPIIIEEDVYSDEKGDYRMMQQQHWQNRGGPGTPLSMEFEELQWPPRFNPTISLGPCGEYLECRKPKTIDKLFEIMQEYCISDKGKRRRLEEMNEQ